MTIFKKEEVLGINYDGGDDDVVTIKFPTLCRNCMADEDWFMLDEYEILTYEEIVNKVFFYFCDCCLMQITP